MTRRQVRQEPDGGLRGSGASRSRHLARFSLPLLALTLMVGAVGSVCVTSARQRPIGVNAAME